MNLTQAQQDALSALNYVIATEIGLQPFTSRPVNFQPAAAPQPDGFAIDSGAVYDPARGYGWDAALPSRDRERVDDQLIDTFVFSRTSWRSRSQIRH